MGTHNYRLPPLGSAGNGPKLRLLRFVRRAAILNEPAAGSNLNEGIGQDNALFSLLLLPGLR